MGEVCSLTFHHRERPRVDQEAPELLSPLSRGQLTNINSVLQSLAVHAVSYDWKSNPRSRRTCRPNSWPPAPQGSTRNAEMKSKRSKRAKPACIPAPPAEHVSRHSCLICGLCLLYLRYGLMYAERKQNSEAHYCCFHSYFQRSCSFLRAKM